MESNACDMSLLDAGALLPPRKRLLAELKRQNLDVNSHAQATCSSVGSEFDSHLNSLLRSQFSNCNLSNKEIVESSRVAAIAAAKVAKAARANAEEKAEMATKAVVAAKRALELVDTLSEEAANKEKLKRNKMKKHVDVQALYNKNKENTYGRTDEELARELHQVINSSPRILKNSSGSDTKNHRHKRLKSVTFKGRTSICCRLPVEEGKLTSMATCNRHGEVDKLDTEGSLKDTDMIIVDLNSSKSEKGDQLRLYDGERLRPSKTDQLKLGKGEVESLPIKDKFTESQDRIVNRRGRIKQKKIPLSICNFRDQTSSEEKLISGGKPQLEDNMLSV